MPTLRRSHRLYGTGVTERQSGNPWTYRELGDEIVMIVAGAILLILGLLFGINLLFVLGLVLLVVGAVLSIRGVGGYPVGRRYWY